MWNRTSHLDHLILDTTDRGPVARKHCAGGAGRAETGHVYPCLSRGHVQLEWSPATDETRRLYPVAIEARVPIIPIRIIGAHRAFPRGSHVLRMTRIQVELLEPVDPTPYLRGRAGCT